MLRQSFSLKRIRLRFPGPAINTLTLLLHENERGVCKTTIQKRRLLHFTRLASSATVTTRWDKAQGHTIHEKMKPEKRTVFTPSAWSNRAAVGVVFAASLIPKNHLNSASLGAAGADH